MPVRCIIKDRLIIKARLPSSQIDTSGLKKNVEAKKNLKIDPTMSAISASQLTTPRNDLSATFGTPQEEEIKTNKESASKPTKRMKERLIQDIVHKVSLWRKLYNGMPDPKDPTQTKRYR